jgi:predicted nucleotidyltransferase
MKRDEVLMRLRAHEAEFRRLGVESLYLFGATAREEAREDSDVDLFFDHERGAIGLELIDIKERASDLLGVTADVMTRRSLHARLKQRIESSATRVF